jgi:hypothetical protein
MRQAEPPSGVVERMRTPPSVTCLTGAKVHRLCDSKREIELRFVPSAREECATFHHDTVFLWLIVSEPEF